MTSISTPATTSTTSTKSNSYEEALQFEIGILHLVLQRNRKQHFRAGYFRRLDMVLRAIKKYSILGSRQTDDDLNISTNMSSGNNNCHNGGDNEEVLGLSQIISFLRDEYDRIASIMNREKGKHKRNSSGTGTTKNNKSQMEEQYWTTSASSVSSTKTSTITITSPTIIQAKKLYKLLTKQIPEILSRILHASSTLYTELSRGYFVPLCTVSLACISRIRTLLIQLCKEGSAQYSIIVSYLQNHYLSYVQIGGLMEKELNIYVRDVQYLLRENNNENGHVDSQSHNQNQNSSIELLLKESCYTEIKEHDYRRILKESLCNDLRQKYEHSNGTARRSKKKRIRCSDDSKDSKDNKDVSRDEDNDDEDNDDEDNDDEQNDDEQMNLNTQTQLGSDSGSEEGYLGSTSNVNTNSDTNIEDIIGERVGLSKEGNKKSNNIGDDDNTNANSNNELNNTNGDKNLEMVMLMKEQRKRGTKASKRNNTNNKAQIQIQQQEQQKQQQKRAINKKRTHNALTITNEKNKRVKQGNDKHEESDEVQRQIIGNDTTTTTTTTAATPRSLSKKKKDKDKKKASKKKKKKKKDVIDDIFDSF
jgi:hypothetical protein